MKRVWVGSRLAWLVPCALAFGVGCVSLGHSPTPRSYVLSTLPGPSEGAAPAGAPLVGVAPVRLPAWLERPQLVTRTGTNEVIVHEQARWAEPLARAVTRTLAVDLAVLLPDRRVVRHPWNAGTRPYCQVEVDVVDFARQGRVVHLEARWAVVPADAGPALARGLTKASVEGRGTDEAAMVAALSDSLGQLAKDLATAIASLPAADAAR